MNLFVLAVGRILLAGICVCYGFEVAAAEEKPLKRAEAPKNLLEDKGAWQPQSGEWKIGADGAAAKAGETLAELTATRATKLAGRWLSFKVALAGESAKAGIWISGVRDARGEILRLSVDAATADLTNGRGKVHAALGDVGPGVELLVRFDTEKVSVFRAGSTVAEMAVTYTEAEGTISLFAERGAARFSELLLSGEAAMAERLAPPVAPDPPRRPLRGRAGVPAPPLDTGIVLDFPNAKALPLKSGWNDYFGLHFETRPGPWKVIRQFDGPGFGFPPKDRHTGDVKTFDGPFSKTAVPISLADFRDWKRKDARGFDDNLRALVQSDKAGLFIAPWAAPFTLIQQDHVWATMKLVYGRNVGAEGRVFFQWGDDINQRRLGVASNPRTIGFEPRGGANASRGANGIPDAAAYAENYFAPAVEAVRRASEEIFHDARSIPIVLGSCARASVPANREWYRLVLEHELAGTNASTLRGRKVLNLVDYLTVNYPFLGVRDASALQELWDRYGSKVKGLWVTEEYGSSSRSTGPFLERIGLYLEWVAANKLDAQQTRLFWNLPGKAGDDRSLVELARVLGETFEGAPLDIAKEMTPNGQIYRVRGGESLILFVFVPTIDRRGGKNAPLTELVVNPPPALANRVWGARFMSAKERLGDANGVVLPIDRREGKLVIPIEARARDAWALLLKADAASVTP